MNIRTANWYPCVQPYPTESIAQLRHRRARYARVQARRAYDRTCVALASCTAALGVATVVLMVLWGAS